MSCWNLRCPLRVSRPTWQPYPNVSSQETDIKIPLKKHSYPQPSLVSTESHIRRHGTAVDGTFTAVHEAKKKEREEMEASVESGVNALSCTGDLETVAYITIDAPQARRRAGIAGDATPQAIFPPCCSEASPKIVTFVFGSIAKERN